MARAGDRHSTWKPSSPPVSAPIRMSPAEADSARPADRSGSGRIPLVTVGMPAYNSRRFIRQSLESLLRQDYERIELIVSDDGSTDGTRDVCAEFAQADPRIVIIEGTHRGERQNFNTVLGLARGKYFMWAADHDVWDAKYVSSCVAALEEDRASVLAYARSALIDLEGRVVPEIDDTLGITQERPIDRYRSLIWRLENCNAIYGLMRSELLKGTGGYGPYPAPDHLVLAKMALHGRFLQVPMTLYYRRQNRPPETGEDQRRRQSFDLDPVEASGWLSRPERDYFRTLRDAHLAAVVAAPISIGDKVLGLTATVACFSQRFGVRSQFWAAAGKILNRMPTRLGRRALDALEHRR